MGDVATFATYIAGATIISMVARSRERTYTLFLCSGRKSWTRTALNMRTLMPVLVVHEDGRIGLTAGGEDLRLEPEAFTDDDGRGDTAGSQTAAQ